MQITQLVNKYLDFFFISSNVSGRPPSALSGRTRVAKPANTASTPNNNIGNSFANEPGIISAYRLIYKDDIYIYEVNLESSKHGIITP